MNSSSHSFGLTIHATHNTHKQNKEAQRNRFFDEPTCNDQADEAQDENPHPVLEIKSIFRYKIRTN